MKLNPTLDGLFIIITMLKKGSSQKIRIIYRSEMR